MLRACLLASTFMLPSLAIADDSPEIPADLREKVVALAMKAAQNRGDATKKEADKSALLPQAKAGVIDANVKTVTIPDTIDKTNPIRFPSAAAKKKFVADLEAELKQLRAFIALPKKEPGDFMTWFNEIKVGQFGILLQDRVNIVKVIDKDSGIIKIVLPQNNPAEAAKGNFPTATVLVSGVDTSTWADGRGADLTKVVLAVIGNKKVGNTTYLQLVAVKFTDEEVKSLIKAATP